MNFTSFLGPKHSLASAFCLHSPPKQPTRFVPPSASHPGSPWAPHAQGEPNARPDPQGSLLTDLLCCQTVPSVRLNPLSGLTSHPHSAGSAKPIVQGALPSALECCSLPASKPGGFTPLPIRGSLFSHPAFWSLIPRGRGLGGHSGPSLGPTL